MHLLRRLRTPPHLIDELIFGRHDTVEVEGTVLGGCHRVKADCVVVYGGLQVRQRSNRYLLSIIQLQLVMVSIPMVHNVLVHLERLV